MPAIRSILRRNIERTLIRVPALSRALLRLYGRAGGLREDNPADWFLRSIAVAVTPRGEAVVAPIGMGLKMRVSIGTGQGRDVYYRRTCEPEVADLLREFLKPGMVFIDGGANCGEMTLRASRHVGPSGRVLSIEASPETAAHLRYNIDMNRLANVTVVDAALGADDSPLSFYLGSAPDSGSSSVTPPHDFAGRVLTVAGTSLDAVAAAHKLDRVDLVKLDIEGAEPAAIRGASRLMAGPHPPTFVFEYNHPVAVRNGWDLSSMVELFYSRDYAVHQISRGQIGAPIDATIIQNAHRGDFVARAMQPTA